MESLFLKLLNMSITATWIALAVIVLRLFLKKAPKAVTVFMWALVAFRLVCPLTVESVLSLVPSAETVPTDIVYSKEPMIHSGIPFVNSTVNPIISESLAPTVGDSVNPMQVVSAVAAYVWVFGMVIMLLYTLISYLKIRHRVKEAAPLEDNIWQCDRIDTPFILGVIRPRIYLPSSIGKTDAEYVTAHEKAHLKRCDHLWKPLGFLLLTVYWFNPVMWVAYILLCRDIELACDEKVIKNLGIEIKKPYSEALINCSVPRKAISACPLAFGENSVKERVKAVLNYKKASFWLIVIAVVACVVLAVVFLTDPVIDTDDDSSVSNIGGASPPSNIVISPNNITIEALKEKYPEYFGLYTSKGLEVYVWQLSPNSYSCGLMSGTNRYKTAEELLALKSTSISEMRAIIASYGISKDNVNVIPITQSYSSYHYVIDEEYTEKVTEIFWADFISYDFSHEQYSFELPHASCTILVASFAEKELSLTIEWKTEEGFTESTKTEYPDYHVKFTVGDSEHFTFLPLPSEWTGDAMTVTDVYRVDMPIDPLNVKRFTMDLYSNDDKTFVRNLIDIFMTSEPSYFESPIFDSMDFDIDGDGVTESCSLGYGPTSGLYTFTIKVCDINGVKYSNTFLAHDYTPICFAQNGIGKYALKCAKYINPINGSGSDIRYYDISVEDGRIVLSYEGEEFGYWGAQN